MKYSPKTRRFHLAMVYTIIARQPKASSREVCRQLDEGGKHLSRGYVTKLIWEAYRKLEAEAENERHYGLEVGSGQIKLEELITEFEGRFRVLKRQFRREIKQYQKNLLDSGKQDINVLLQRQ